MHLNLSLAALLCVAVTLPLGHTYPHGTSLDRRGQTLSLAAAHGVSLRTDADEKLKRRYTLLNNEPRGIPKLGERPPPPKQAPGGKPGVGKGAGGDDVGKGAGNNPGTVVAPVFGDSNLERARAKGEGLNNDLTKAIFDERPAPELKNLQQLGYTVKSKKPKDGVADTDKENTFLQPLNINTRSDQWRDHIVYREGADTVSRADQPIQQNFVDSSQGVIIVKKSYQDRDQANPKATWTDFVHNSWMAECRRPGTTGKDPKGLKYIVRENIQSIPKTDTKGIELNTQTAIDTVFEKLAANKGEVLKIDAKSTDVNVKASYELLSAQAHVARVLQWLKDRHGDLGAKTIARLHVNHGNHPSGQYNIVIELA